MITLEEQLALLIDSISQKESSVSVSRMKDATEACEELLLWIDYLKNLFPDCYASELLEGTRASMLESVAYIGLCLGRAAIGAIRTQTDLMLGFTYFYDHPREWNSVKSSGSGFKLRSDIDKYHREIRDGFGKNINIIDNSEGTSLLKLYRILSAHIHGQSPLTVPKAGEFRELISSDSFIQSLITIQKKVSRCLSNYLAAVFISEGISPPFDIGRRIKEQLTPAQRKAVFFED
ncbi:MAG: hypothetical protein GY795_48530 [Desulfobacterales bacterium]|nr:hypothetical protein [Desulfobacterales bacterium]